MSEHDAGSGELQHIRAELAEIKGMVAQLSTQLGKSPGVTGREVARLLVIAMLSIAVGAIYGWVLTHL